MIEDMKLDMTTEEYYRAAKTPVYAEITNVDKYYKKITKMIAKSMTWLYFRSPFFSFLGSRKKLIITKDPKITNVVTDFRFIYYPYSRIFDVLDAIPDDASNADRAKFDAEIVAEFTREIIHSVMHIALFHHERFVAGGFDKRLFKVACDIGVFFALTEMQKKFNENGYNAKWVLPDMSKHERFKTKTVDTIYRTLYDELDKEPQDDSGSGGSGGSGDGPPQISQSQIGDLEDELGSSCSLEQYSDIVKDLKEQLPENSDVGKFVENQMDQTEGDLKSAMSRLDEKSIGSMPGGLADRIKEKQTPIVNWRSVLARYLTPLYPADYQMKPNKKYLPHDLLMPSIKKDGLNLFLIVDTSGSVSDKELQNFVTEVRSLMKIFPSAQLTLIDVDTKIQKIRDLDQSSSPKDYEKFYGRGGTRFMPAFTEEEGVKLLRTKQPALIMYYTDGEGHDYPSAKDCKNIPLIWLMTQKPAEIKRRYGRDGKLPYGATIYVDPRLYADKK